MRFASPAWYRRVPIRLKIFLWFAPLLIATISATGAYAFRIAAGEMTAKLQAEQQSAASAASDHLDYIAQDAAEVANYLFLMPEIQALLASDASSGKYVSYQNVNDSINRLMVTRPYFQFLTIYSHRFAPIQFNNKGLSTAISFEEYRRLYDYDAALRDAPIDSWSVETPGQADRIFYGDQMTKVLLTRVLKNSRNYEAEGVLLLGIDEADIRASYAPAAGSAEIAVVSEDGIVLSDSGGRWIGKPARELPYFREDAFDLNRMDDAVDSSSWLAAHEQSPQTGWHVLVLRPRSELLRELDRITWTTASIVLVTILVSMILSWTAAGWITQPIRLVLSSMKRFQKGQFDERVDIVGQDEVGELGAGYNIMVQRIRQLVDDVYASELKQKQAELKLLQSQINPHFLYNTLNTIAWTAQKHNDKLVADMVYSLSGIFKTSLNQGGDLVELREEFQLLEHYLFLQKMRFPSHLAYELDLAPDVSGFPIPKLLIQPLVENSIVHGIEPLADELGLIQVKAAAADGALSIEVTDNGVGIPADRLEALRNEPDGRDDSGYALHNVRSRLRLHYGDGASLDLHSEPGSGTRVTIAIPMKRG
ncbi:sensor histidine kinase [Paenibacillus sp.]|uniref:sensor histidine kinase n=1 Tax=Paenibacillus sp. TaxID=58172 RepID=UPI002D6DACC5|nr:sensor histidine kinase [Paenibacillus sp.]HZG86881.1 sensor histidine kinase [Paenibacillus sp.]